MSCSDPQQRVWAERGTRIRITGGVAQGGSRVYLRLGRLAVEVWLSRGMTPRETALALSAALPKSIRCDVLDDPRLDDEGVVVALAASRAPRVQVFANDLGQEFFATDRNAFVVSGCAAPDHVKGSYVVLTIEDQVVKLQLLLGDSPQQTARRLLSVLPDRFRRALLYKDGAEETAPVRFVVLG